MDNRITRILRQAAQEVSKVQDVDEFTLWDIVTDIATEDGAIATTENWCRMFLNMAVPLEHRDLTFYYYLERRVASEDRKSVSLDLANKSGELAQKLIADDQASYLASL